MTGSHGARRQPGSQMIRPALLAGAGGHECGATALTEDGCTAWVPGPPALESPPLFSPVLKDKAWGDVLDDLGNQYEASWALPGFHGRFKIIKTAAGA